MKIMNILKINISIYVYIFIKIVKTENKNCDIRKNALHFHVIKI